MTLPEITVYKYISEDALNKYYKNYLKGEVYFPSWSKLNDPKEGYFSYNCDEVEHLKKLVEKIVDEKSKFKIFSCTTSYDNAELWEKYATDRGACLEFRVDDEFLVANEISKHEIQYYEKLPNLRDLKTEDEKELAILVLTRKLKKWKDEKELRLIKEMESSGTIEIGQLTSIIFGKESDARLRNRMKAIYENHVLKSRNTSDHTRVGGKVFIRGSAIWRKKGELECLEMPVKDLAEIAREV